MAKTPEEIEEEKKKKEEMEKAAAAATIKELTETVELAQGALTKAKAGEAVDPKGLKKIGDLLTKLTAKSAVEKKADPRTIKALTEAQELLQSAITKVKAGEDLDAKGLGKIVDALQAVKGRYPVPKSKTLKLDEFGDWAKDQLKKAVDAEPATRVARLAQVKDQVEAAQKAFDDGAETVDVPGEIEVSPLAVGTEPDTNFSAFAARLDSIDKAITDLGTKVEKKADPEPTEPAWPRDMAPDRATSKDPTLKWGVEKSVDPVDRDWGPDEVPEA